MPGYLPLELNAGYVDFNGRVATTNTVVASPSAAAETVIANVTIPGAAVFVNGVLLMGWAAFTVGASGVSVQLRVRQTNVSGNVVANTGVVTRGIAAAALTQEYVQQLDGSPGTTLVYAMTLTVGSAAAASTVSACNLTAFVL